jgi:hypothetical protein
VSLLKQQLATRFDKQRVQVASSLSIHGIPGIAQDIVPMNEQNQIATQSQTA